ncbi:hypothetical protein [Pandoraea sp.]|uniref:hypothetical protein n=1 Tax=Pandoraea sp. TaxID=1883445 RepID=UPI00120E0CDD|nr:hypothetical protein [Pandoraea sp.]TAL54728.1 MAG: hypothetical protein EPN80_09555 [Pandoraea sp.]TAM18504.1 MAG: hypothetical protein EPN65_07085 [Pandoraea sp.]
MSHALSMHVVAFAALLCSLGTAPITVLASGESTVAASSRYTPAHYPGGPAFLAGGTAPAHAGAQHEFRPHGDLRADIYRHLQDHEQAAQSKQAPGKRPSSRAGSRRTAPR